MDVAPHRPFLSVRNFTYFSFFSELYHSDHAASTVVETLVISVVFLVSLVANVGATVLVTRERRPLTNKTVLALNLFVADLLFVSMIPLIVAVRWTVSWTLGFTACHVLLFVICMSGSVTINTLASISVERLQAILRLQAGPTLNPRVVSATLVLIWAFSALTALPDSLFFTVMEVEIPEQERVHICTMKWPNSTEEVAWDISFTALCFLLPGLIIVISYSKILQIAKSSKRRIRTQESPPSAGGSPVYHVSRQDMKLFRTLLVLVFSFLLMWSPIFINTFLILARNYLGDLHVTSTTFFWVMTFTLTNSALNPILYSVCQFKKSWHKFCCSSAVVPFRQATSVRGRIPPQLGRSKRMHQNPRLC